MVEYKKLRANLKEELRKTEIFELRLSILHAINQLDNSKEGWEQYLRDKKKLKYETY